MEVDRGQRAGDRANRTGSNRTGMGHSWSLVVHAPTFVVGECNGTETEGSVI